MQRMRCASMEDGKAKAKSLQEAKIALSGNEYFKYLNVRFLVVADGTTKGAFINAMIHNFLSVYITVHVLSMEDAKIGAFLSHVFTCYLCEYDALCAKQNRKIQEHPQQRLIREHAFCVAMALNANVQPPARVYGTPHTVESLVEMQSIPNEPTIPTLSTTEKEELRTCRMAVDRLRENAAAASKLEYKLSEEAKKAKEEKKLVEEELRRAKEEGKAFAVQCAAFKAELQALKNKVVDTSPISVPSCETFSAFVNTRYHSNYVLCSENPSYGYTILRNIKQREELRQKKNKGSWIFEDHHGLEPLDSELPVTPKQIAFLLRYHENKNYTMRRLNNHEEKMDGPVEEPMSEEEEEDGQPPLKKSRKETNLVDMLVEEDPYFTEGEHQFNIDWMSNYQE